MIHWEKVNFIKDISDFLAIIAKYDAPIDVSKIYALQSGFEYGADYKINVNDIVFNVDSKISGTIPFEVKKLAIFFNHTCEFDLRKDKSNEDLIMSSYHFQIKIIGYCDDDGEYVNYWRLDQDQPGAGIHKSTHPYYHFQVGGDEMAGIDTGKAIFTGAPRIAHPPMDLFLGFHFIINNFYNNKQYQFVNQIMSDHTYQDIIIRAQNRLWEPYFSAFKEVTTHSNFTKERVFPLYIN